MIHMNVDNGIISLETRNFSEPPSIELCRSDQEREVTMVQPSSDRLHWWPPTNTKHQIPLYMITVSKTIRKSDSKGDRHIEECLSWCADVKGLKT